MTAYGRINVTIDSSMGAFATEIGTILTTLQGISAAERLFSAAAGPAVNIIVQSTNGESHWNSNTGIMYLNSSDCNYRKYIDFSGLLKILAWQVF